MTFGWRSGRSSSTPRLDILPNFHYLTGVTHIASGLGVLFSIVPRVARRRKRG